MCGPLRYVCAVLLTNAFAGAAYVFAQAPSTSATSTWHLASKFTHSSTWVVSSVSVSATTGLIVVGSSQASFGSKSGIGGAYFLYPTDPTDFTRPWSLLARTNPQNTISGTFGSGVAIDRASGASAVLSQPTLNHIYSQPGVFTLDLRQFVAPTPPSLASGAVTNALALALIDSGCTDPGVFDAYPVLLTPGLYSLPLGGMTLASHQCSVITSPITRSGTLAGPEVATFATTVIQAPNHGATALSADGSAFNIRGVTMERSSATDSWVVSAEAGEHGGFAAAAVSVSQQETPIQRAASAFIKTSTAAVTVDSSVLRGGRAFRGGAILATTSAASVTASRCLFEGNAASSGGAVQLGDAATAAFSDCVFANNTALAVGGAVAVDAGSAVSFSSPTVAGVIHGGLLQFNSADNGGAVFIGLSGSVDVQADWEFDRNTATDSGGALYLGSPLAASLQQVILSGNAAVGQGGAAYVNANSVPVTLDGVTLVDNCTVGSGGAIFGRHGGRWVVCRRHRRPRGWCDPLP